MTICSESLVRTKLNLLTFRAWQGGMSNQRDIHFWRLPAERAGPGIDKLRFQTKNAGFGNFLDTFGIVALRSL